ncbi:MAG TPA: AbrB/MazE/SpoVT family DNA-binding domain-containing protein [Candidatus Nanoarchaeia archaeon]|nr:AbrB/MazE/SpoVT family DNA-binding domain-containing protein [Candidatus Nanoarchaeia archaeon]
MTTLTQKGQATIPKNVREILGIHPGDEIEFEVEEDIVTIHKVEKELPFYKWRGYLGKLRTKDIMDELR